MVEKKEEYHTTAPKKKQITIETGSYLENALGNSVNKHKEMEQANLAVTGDEIRQQNENL
ncbi:hypothetical protein [Lysinibacillus sp. BW-2-10]|uniref:hypothetical protein n=1 Tax=Lysinibacillus sp. BW-2-10 TaxID=2590030 RepID=UPI00118157B1|nr:hypothetical protein [Lysinibacillus sp. BW-2-10]TSI11264.1 hypothetical protein FJQ64_01715 [Lysinibacillus sp. BW-2-10]